MIPGQEGRACANCGREINLIPLWQDCRARAASTIVFVVGQAIVQYQPRLRPGSEEVAVGLEPRGVIKRAGLDGDVVRIDVKFSQERRTAPGAKVPMNGLSGIS